MKIKFERETRPDELYNALLMHFVREAVAQGAPVDPHSQFTNWRVECELHVATH